MRIGIVAAPQFSQGQKFVDLPGCRIRRLDPFAPEIRRFLPSKRDRRRRACTPSYQRRSSLDADGTLHIAPLAAKRRAEEICAARCLFPKGDRNLHYGDWILIEANGTRLPCDVFGEQRAAASSKSTLNRRRRLQMFGVELAVSARPTNFCIGAFSSSRERIALRQLEASKTSALIPQLQPNRPTFTFSFWASDRKSPCKLKYCILDSVSRNQFIRSANLSYNFLTRQLGLPAFRRLENAASRFRRSRFQFS